MTSHEQQQPTVVIQTTAGNTALGTAGLIFSTLGWLTCGILTPLGALLSLLGLFGKGAKTHAIVGLIVGFPGTIMMVMFGGAILTFALGVVGIGGGVIADAKMQADRAKARVEAERNTAPEVSPSDSLADSPIDQNDGDANATPVLPSTETTGIAASNASMPVSGQLNATVEAENNQQSEITPAQSFPERELPALSDLTTTESEVIKVTPPTPSRPQPPKFRKWISENRKFTVEAKLLSVSDTEVELERKDNGKTIKVPISKLSKFDQGYAARYADTGTALEVPE